ncbi:micrococcal nuclease [Pseudarthrobacter oxydans]|uniref:thermonuclease family protein n=1 Tax=Pseudarthrobacter oxydans TaxID=1671 RepID=UPI002782BA92|nr:thermonuclease family protein [Pseudarthrobacter oxydans]MDP9980693.1 micrococcal nuclease [Pseudarthrobacter oxydans]
MLLETSGTAARTKAVGLAIAAVMALTGCNAGSAGTEKNASGPASNSARDEAVVVRVVDGDTFEASINGEQKTVRLLNVDTPETKDPKAPVECMGPEATKALEQLLPVGSKVTLELDKEPLDKYGRTLAGVFDSNGRLINAEVARMGLGVPVLFEPNRKFYPPVVTAFEDARTRGVGLNSAEIPCLPAQQIEQAARTVETIVAAPLAEATTDLDESHAGLVAALAAVAVLKAAANAKNHVHWAAYKEPQLTAMVNRLDSAAEAGAAHKTTIGARKKALADAAAAESARQAAEAAAAAAAAAEAERLRNLPPVPAPYVPPAYVPPAYVPPAAPAPAPNPYPGYNGPRCYAPGGQTWTPCSKR